MIADPFARHVERLRLALRALWPDRPVVYFTEAGGQSVGPGPVLTEEEQQQLARIADTIAAAERRGEERAADGRDAYRDGLAALVDAVERVDRNSPNARYSATVIPAALLRARRLLDAGPS